MKGKACRKDHTKDVGEVGSRKNSLCKSGLSSAYGPLAVFCEHDELAYPVEKGILPDDFSKTTLYHGVYLTATPVGGGGDSNAQSTN